MGAGAGSTVCLSMIVRDEAPVVTECLASVAPAIDHWVVVDTGSVDDTPAVVEAFFADAGIPGEVVHRPWRDFAHNRTEALDQCRGRADYALVMDADDVLVEVPDLSDLTADGYLVALDLGIEFWRPLLLRLDRPWRFEGVVHECAVLDGLAEPLPRLPGARVRAGSRGARSHDPDRFRKDAALLEAVVAADPADTRAAFYLAQSWHDAGEFEAALVAYRRRADLGGWEEEVFWSRLRVAQCLERLGRPWAEVQEALLAAWEGRPHRAEPLVALARHHRLAGDHHQAHLFATRAAALPFPQEELLFLDVAAHRWQALDELAIAAFWVGRPRESFAANCRLLDGPHLPDEEWERVLANRDHSVDLVWGDTLVHPTAVVEHLVARGPLPDPEVTLSIMLGPRPDLVEATLDSFLNCCADVERIGRFLLVDAGSPAADRDRLVDRYPFLEPVAVAGTGPAERLEALCRTVTGPYWLHLEEPWHVVVPLPYVTRAVEILEDDDGLDQVLFNRAEGDPPAGEVRRTPSGRRYRSVAGRPDPTRGPSLLRTGGRGEGDRPDPRTAALDQVTAIRLAVPAAAGADDHGVPIHVVVPVRDQWPYTRAIVDQVLAEPVASLTVMDNGSTDGTAERLARIDDPRLTVLHRPGAGLHEMWNEGWRRVLPGPAALAVLNNDVVLAPATLTRLRDALYAEDDRWVAYPDHRRRLQDGDEADGTVTATEGTFAQGGMSGFCFMLRAEAHEAGLPFFDEGFRWWFGDDDLVRNVRRAGRQVVRVDGLPVEHVQEATARSHDLDAVKAADHRRWLAKVADDDPA